MTTARVHPHFFQHRRLAETLLLMIIAAAAGAVVASAPWDNGSSSNTVVGSGNVVSVVRTVPPFTGVDLAGTNNVSVHVGSAQRVVVRADDNLVRNVTTRVVEGRLVIDDIGNFRTSGTMAVDVYLPTLVTARHSGDGNVTVDGVKAERFAVTTTGTGLVTVGGAADWLRARLTGDGSLELGNLRARHATALLHGTGRIAVNATHTLDAVVTGTGSVNYSGNPVVRQRVTGTGAVVRD